MHAQNIEAIYAFDALSQPGNPYSALSIGVSFSMEIPGLSKCPVALLSRPPEPKFKSPDPTKHQTGKTDGVDPHPKKTIKRKERKRKRKKKKKESNRIVLVLRVAEMMGQIKCKGVRIFSDLENER